jgi:hypothetical protein
MAEQTEQQAPADDDQLTERMNEWLLGGGGRNQELHEYLGMTRDQFQSWVSSRP